MCALCSHCGRHDRPPHEAALLQRCERLVVALPDAPAPVGDLVGVLELRPEERRARARSGGYDEPRSTQRVLVDLPAEEPQPVRALLAAGSRRARRSAGSLTSSAPPSPQLTFFVSWKLSAPSVAERAERPAAIASQQDPAPRPRSRAGRARPASSQDRVHLARRRPRSAPARSRCVRGVIAASTQRLVDVERVLRGCRRRRASPRAARTRSPWRRR